ncbi:MAG: hypothetical protein WCL02_06520 [bacterium]
MTVSGIRLVSLCQTFTVSYVLVVLTVLVVVGVVAVFVLPPPHHPHHCVAVFLIIGQLSLAC